MRYLSLGMSKSGVAPEPLVFPIFDCDPDDPHFPLFEPTQCKSQIDPISVGMKIYKLFREHETASYVCIFVSPRLIILSVVNEGRVS